MSAFAVPGSLAATSPTAAFDDVWARTDDPVTYGKITRTWMWGPQTQSPTIMERYANSPAGKRLVLYFDKSRMEITSPTVSRTSPWYVTNGLLAQELVTGRRQLGDTTFEQFAPAEVNVAGDLDDTNGPTYATFNKLTNFSAIPNGWKIVQTIDRSGHVGADESLGSYDAYAMDVGAATNHTVASVFWDFMTSSGIVNQKGKYVTDALFQNAFYATGLPITEPYWTTVRVGGTPKQVLVQVFERRVLTYTPDNSPGWKVEAGNVGQHYFQWRYNRPLESNPTSIEGVDLSPATITYYSIGGATDAEMTTQLKKYGPKPNIATFNSVISAKWTATRKADATCTLSDVTASFTTTIYNPLWEQNPDAPPELVAQWKELSRELALHDLDHIDIVRDNLYLVVNAINASDCTHAQTALRDGIKQIDAIADTYDKNAGYSGWSGDFLTGD